MTDRRVPSVDFEKAAAELNNALKEAAYMAVGLGVLGFQRAQVQRVELMKQLEAQRDHLNRLQSTLSEQVTDARAQLNLPDADTLRTQLAELAKAVDEALAPVRHQLDEQFDRLEEALPEAARSVVHSVRSAASTQGRALRSAVGLD